MRFQIVKLRTQYFPFPLMPLKDGTPSNLLLCFWFFFTHFIMNSFAYCFSNNIIFHEWLSCDCARSCR